MRLCVTVCVTVRVVLSFFFSSSDRALDLLRRRQPVPRGCVQATFKHAAFDEVARLGIQSSALSAVRTTKAAETGMLIVRRVLTGGGSDGLLQPGDVLFKV